MRTFAMHYMANNLAGNWCHFAIYLDAKDESAAYTLFHNMGYSGWFLTMEVIKNKDGFPVREVLVRPT